MKLTIALEEQLGLFFMGTKLIWFLYFLFVAFFRVGLRNSLMDTLSDMDVSHNRSHSHSLHISQNAAAVAASVAPTAAIEAKAAVKYPNDATSHLCCFLRCRAE